MRLPMSLLWILFSASTHSFADNRSYPMMPPTAYPCNPYQQGCYAPPPQPYYPPQYRQQDSRWKERHDIRTENPWQRDERKAQEYADKENAYYSRDH